MLIWTTKFTKLIRLSHVFSQEKDDKKKVNLQLAQAHNGVLIWVQTYIRTDISNYRVALLQKIVNGQLAQDHNCVQVWVELKTNLLF